MKFSSITSLFSRFTSDNSVHHCERQNSDSLTHLSYPAIEFSMTAAAPPNTVRIIRLNTGETFRMTGKIVGNLGHIFIETMAGASLYVMRPNRDYNSNHTLVIHDTMSGIVYRVRRRQTLLSRFTRKVVVSAQNGWQEESEIFEMQRLKTTGGLRLTRLADGAVVGKTCREKVRRDAFTARESSDTIGTIEPFTNPHLVIMIVAAIEVLFK